jgi:hypothetical protein
MKAKIRNGSLIVTVSLIDPPRLSSSGKRLLVATSRGVCRTSLKIDKKPVDINLNAFIRPDKHRDKNNPEISKSRARGKGSRIRREMLKRWQPLL